MGRETDETQKESVCPFVRANLELTAPPLNPLTIDKQSMNSKFQKGVSGLRHH